MVSICQNEQHSLIHTLAIWFKDLKMQSQSREFWLMNLAILVILCLCLTTDTPKALVFLAGALVIIGSLGWFYSKDLEFPPPWIVRLTSTVMIILGIAFLLWYFTIGHTLLHPLIDLQRIFESINESLVTPTP
jgi:hypothetical protein